MEREIERARIGIVGLFLILFASTIAIARWFYSGKAESRHLWIAIGFLLLVPRAYAYRRFVPGAKLPLWTGALATLGLLAMTYGLVLRWT